MSNFDSCRFNKNVGHFLTDLSDFTEINCEYLLSNPLFGSIPS